MVVGLDSNPNQPVIVDTNTGVGSTPYENADFGSTTAYNTNQATQGTNPYSNLMDSKVDGQSEMVTEMKTDGSKILARSQDEDELISDEGEGNRKGFWFKGRYYKAKPGQKGGPKPGTGTGGGAKPPTMSVGGPISGGGGTVTIGGGSSGGMKTLPGVGTGRGQVVGGTGGLGRGLNLGGSIGVGGIGSGFGTGFVNPISNASSTFTNPASAAQQRVLVQPSIGATVSKVSGKIDKEFAFRKKEEKEERRREEDRRSRPGERDWRSATYTEGRFDYDDRGVYTVGNPTWARSGTLGDGETDWNFKSGTPARYFEYDWQDVSLAQHDAMRRTYGPEGFRFFERWVNEQVSEGNPSLEGVDVAPIIESARPSFESAVLNPDTGEYEAESTELVSSMGNPLTLTLLGLTSLYVVVSYMRN